MNEYQTYTHLSKYARYRDKDKRRETWEETVARYCDFFRAKFGDVFPYDDIYSAIFNLDVMPSMRALMTAGPALERDNMAGFNCSYVPIESVRDLDEILYILMCGTGVGFSVERQYINKLPEVPELLYPTDTTIIVADSKIGWASALRELLSLMYAGKIPKWDLSRLRKAGERLKTFGGRSSGPGPLDGLFRFVVDHFNKAKGRRFNSVEVHDLVCKIADAVVVGGVRRSALISLSNLTDERMAGAKTGQWWENFGHRALANNSVCYTEKPDIGIFMKEWLNLYQSKSGERGVFNRVAANKKAKESGRRELDQEWGTNPCGEVILRPHGLCNLTEVVIRTTDTWDTLEKKVEIASIMGTFQSTLTDFRYVRNIWKKNAEEERLLGVSLTGITDNPITIMADEEPLTRLEEKVIGTNKEWADRLGINASVACTTVKPSGTVSQLVDSSSGIHPRYSRFYSRAVRADKKDPLALFMRAKGFPVEDDVTNPEHTDVFYFPIESPPDTLVRYDLSALDQLELYLTYRRCWCEHNVSMTVYVRDNEWLEVAAWVYKHFDEIGGVSFLPYDTGIYRQAPYTELTKEEYDAMVVKMPKDVDWTELKEENDTTVSSQEMACSGSNSCDFI